MPEAINVIGEKGGGKTLFAVWRACQVANEYPGVPIVENIGINIEPCHHVGDILRFLAAKIICRDNSPMEFLIDEAAISGFEARDSHGLGSAIRSYLLALSRKSNSNLWLITQMMSMIEKRGQWLSDYDMLCEAHYETPASYELHIPDYFEYTTYNANRIKTNELTLYGRDCLPLFDLYNTNSIPNEDNIAAEFIQFFRIQEADIEEFCNVAKMDRDKMALSMSRFLSIRDALRPDEEDLDELLGPFIDLLTFDRKEDVEYVETKEDEHIPKSKWGVMNEVLKDKGYHYVRAQAGIRGHWEKAIEPEE